MNIIKRKKLFFIISGIIIIPGLISLLLWGLNFGIDFTGGSRFEFSYPKNVEFRRYLNVFAKNGAVVKNVRYVSNGAVIRTQPVDHKINTKIINEFKNISPQISQKSFDTVGPTIGAETVGNAIKAVLIASLIITAYIAFTFREISRPVSSLKFGVCAIAALLHDVFVVVGAFSLLGHFLGVEVDALFITALLTVMGFSVHDTIVVFDRIRENLRKNVSRPFGEIVNNSVLETFNRSVNTSLTVVLVLFSLLLFGGESIRWFIVALLVGIISGTYSSIFNASPLLVAWYEWDLKRAQK